MVRIFCFATLCFLLPFGVQAQTRWQDGATMTYLKGLGDRPVFVSSCRYSADEKEALLIPAGSTRGWFVSIFSDGSEAASGVVDISKASRYETSVEGGEASNSIGRFLALYLMKSPFTVLKPADFHLIFDGKVTNKCPYVPDDVSHPNPFAK